MVIPLNDPSRDPHGLGPSAADWIKRNWVGPSARVYIAILMFGANTANRGTAIDTKVCGPHTCALEGSVGRFSPNTFMNRFQATCIFRK